MYVREAWLAGPRVAVSAYMELAREEHVPRWNSIRQSAAIRQTLIRTPTRTETTCGDYLGSD
jgi:hypothetical protein